jgi:hypothetical protein
MFMCHCAQCRKISGSSYASNLFSDTSSLVWTKGEDNIVRFDAPGRDFTKAFCRTCGSGVPYASNSSDKVIIPAGSLNAEPNSAQNFKIFMAENTHWTSNYPEAKTCQGFPEF